MLLKYLPVMASLSRLLGDFVWHVPLRNLMFSLHLTLLFGHRQVFETPIHSSKGRKNAAPHSTVKAFKYICSVLMNNSPFSFGFEEPLSPVTGAIEVFQPWANAAVTSVYCCISLAWISDVPQLLLLCCGYCARALHIVFSVFPPLTLFDRCDTL